MLKKNLIIIPARKGSKRIKNKNLVKILKKPLIFWTIKYAKKFNFKNYDLIVTSDTPGVGEAHPGVTNCVFVIGKALEDDDTENLVRLINVLI